MTAEGPGIRRGFIVLAGADVNSVIGIPESTSIIGRDGNSDIRLPYEGVSRRHLVLDGTGPSPAVTDLGSTNGMWVNGRQEHGPVHLHDGDTLKVGSVELRYFDANAARQSWSPQVDPNWVTRPNTRPAGNYVAQNQNFHITGFEDPTDEIFNGRGPGRVIAILGGVIGLTGFGIFFYNIISSIANGGPPNGRSVGIGFGAAFVGIVLMLIGEGISKASRKRREKPTSSMGGASINVAGGNQFVGSNSGNFAFGDGAVAIGAVPPAVRPSIQSLLEQAHQLLPPERFARVQSEIAALERDMTSQRPNPGDAAARLQSVVDIMKQGDAAVRAGTSLVEHVTKIAGWIGPLAGAVARSMGQYL